jgi:hypothetical protein
VQSRLAATTPPPAVKAGSAMLGLRTVLAEPPCKRSAGEPDVSNLSGSGRAKRVNNPSHSRDYNGAIGYLGGWKS